MTRRRAGIATALLVDAPLRAPHRLLIVPGAGHDGVLGAPGVLEEVDSWIRRIQ